MTDFDDAGRAQESLNNEGEYANSQPNMTTTKTDAQTVLEALMYANSKADILSMGVNGRQAYELRKIILESKQALPAAQRLVDAPPTTSEEV